MALPPPDPDSTCLVTGASSGIGSEIARGLAARGYGVTLVARREDRLEDLAAELADEHGVRAEIVAADVSKVSQRKRLAKDVEALGLTVEVLVNNAGFGSGGRFTKLDGEKEASMVRTNCEAIVALTNRYVTGMVERGQGAILNLSSIASFQPIPFQATYGATKAFVRSFTDALHEELRGTGVTATAVSPGPVRTEFGDQGGFGNDDDRIPGFIWISAEKVAEDALDALESGDRIVVPGPLNRLAAMYGHYLPRSVLLPIVRRVWPVS